MLINGGTTTGATTNLHGAGEVRTGRDTHKVVIVNGSAEVLELLETVLDAGRYDVVFVESNAHAYSQIKRVQPNLVIVCVQIDDLDSFQVLSMLKLDDDTRDIPILTYTTELDGHAADDEEPEQSDVAIFAQAPAPRMH